MTKRPQNAASWSDTIKARKAHLETLLKTINAADGIEGWLKK